VWVSIQAFYAGQESMGLLGPEDRMDLDSEDGRCCDEAEQEERNVSRCGGEPCLHDDGGSGSDKGPWLDERGDDDGMPRRHLVYARLPFRGLPGFLRPAHPPALSQGDEQQPGADGDLNGEHGRRWRGPGFRRLIARCENSERDHDGERQEPAEDECGSFSYAALRGENQEERRERKRFERDRQTDEDKVKNHDRLGLSGQLPRGRFHG
jgi:hypothetical protein